MHTFNNAFNPRYHQNHTVLTVLLFLMLEYEQISFNPFLLSWRHFAATLNWDIFGDSQPFQLLEGKIWYFQSEANKLKFQEIPPKRNKTLCVVYICLFLLIYIYFILLPFVNHLKIPESATTAGCTDRKLGTLFPTFKSCSCALRVKS